LEVQVGGAGGNGAGKVRGKWDNDTFFFFFWSLTSYPSFFSLQFFSLLLCIFLTMVYDLIPSFFLLFTPITSVWDTKRKRLGFFVYEQTQLDKTKSFQLS